MNDGEFDAKALIGAMAPMIGIAVAATDIDEVASHLEAARRIAADVLAFELEDDAEPAPVYRP